MHFTKKAAIASSLLLGQASAALPPIIMKGSKFFYENGTQFFMNGIAYQQDSAAAGATTGSTKYLDPLANEAACTRDVPLLKALRTNTIRTYAIDPTADHDACMKLLDDAGIYVISDLSEPALSINRDDPTWDVDLLDRYTKVVDSLAKYSNVIGFFAGNEVTNSFNNTQASAFVKAAVRDTKAHIKKNHPERWLGVGYATNDDGDIRDAMAAYFNCGDQEQAIDYWGYNIYSWCGESSFEKSGYATHVKNFQNYSVPVFLAEYGCNVPNGAAARIWQETTALYSDLMTPVFSGGIVYMYFQEENDYGVVKVQGNAAVTQKDFAPLATRMASIKPSSTAMSAYTPTNLPQECPPVNKNWQVKGDALPRTPNRASCECMVNAASCAPASDLTAREYKEIFDFICGDPKVCAGITAHPETGVYGAYSMCNAKQKLTYVLDAYYKSQGNAKDACDFRGKAVLARNPSVPDSCKSAIASASSINSVVATATSASGTDGGGSGSGSGSGKKDNSAAGPQRSLFTMGDLAIGLYAVVAMGVGAGVVLL